MTRIQGPTAQFISMSILMRFQLLTGDVKYLTEKRREGPKHEKKVPKSNSQNIKKFNEVVFNIIRDTKLLQTNFIQKILNCIAKVNLRHFL